MRHSIRRKMGGVLLKMTLLISLAAGLVAPAGGSVNAADAVLLPEISQATDLAGHWANELMSEWAQQGLIKGFPDGTIRPDEVITRVQFVALVNRLFALNGGAAATTFKDVPTHEWFAAEVNAAVQAGYVQGFPDQTFRPEKPLQRVEAVTMLAGLVPTIPEQAFKPDNHVKDWKEVPAFGRNALSAALTSGLIQGYRDDTVRPLQSLTRAEAVTLLERIRAGSAPSADGGIAPNARVLPEGGTYGPSEGKFVVGGSLQVASPGTTLRNVVIKGDLTILPSVGEGDVFLQQVEVRGRTFINGGGSNSIYIENSELGSVIIEKIDGRVRVVANGTTTIEQLDIQTDASIEAPSDSGAVIEGIAIFSSGEVTLSGAFSYVAIKGDVKLTVAAGSIDHLEVTGGIVDAVIRLEKDVTVDKMTLQGATEVVGTGTIGTAYVESDQVSFETEPAAIVGKDQGDAGVIPGGGGAIGGVPQQPEPTVTPGPTAPSDINVTASVSQPSTSGFRLAFHSKVSHLSTADISLRNELNQPIAAGTPATLDGGFAYRIPATLIEGVTYRLMLNKAGYDFGSELTFTVPVTSPEPVQVTALAGGISATGFTLSLDRAVEGLTAAHFSLVRKSDNLLIAVGEPVSKNDGAAYLFNVALVEGVTYALSIVKDGYSFGDAATVFVPVTDPGIVAVQGTVGSYDGSGVTLSLVPPVTGLTEANFVIAPAGGGTAVQITALNEMNAGASYVLAAELAEGESYEIHIEKQGYSFGPALPLTVSGEVVVVYPTISRISTAGFIVAFDRQVPQIDALNFALTSGESAVGINMLSPLQGGLEYEVWSTLTTGETYSLSLSKAGYVFADGKVDLLVEPSLLPTALDWVTPSGFKLRLLEDIVQLPFAFSALEDEAGSPVSIDALQAEGNGRTVIVRANLTAGETYRYRIDIDDDRYVAGTIVVPDVVQVARQTTFSSLNEGITVHFSLPVPGMEIENFQLSDTSDTPIGIDSVLTTDGGSSYYLEAPDMEFRPLKLDVARNGYDFGESASLIRTTLAPAYVGAGPNNFIAGLNPAVEGLTVDNFRIVNAAGETVQAETVEWFTFQNYYIVSYSGPRGLPTTVSVEKDGYDFGAPAVITLEPEYRIKDVSYSGLTFVLNPPTAINVVNGFEIRRSNGTIVPGITVSTVDGGGSYRVRANLTPGDYTLRLSASLNQTTFGFNVPVLATISADQITHTGLRVSLNYPLNGLGPDSFTLTRTDTGEPVAVQSAATADGGRTYRLEANLAGGEYAVRLTGHLPTEGFAFTAETTIGSGTAAVEGAARNGFNLLFGQAVPGLLLDDMALKDDQNRAIRMTSLSTSDGGLTYRINAALSSGVGYTLSLSKDYVEFGAPVSFAVPVWVTGSVAEITRDGNVSITFDPPLPQLEYGGIEFKDAEGIAVSPDWVEVTGGGAHYRFQFYSGDGLLPGISYTASIHLSGYQMEPLSFALPSGYSVTQASTTGATVAFDVPLPGLVKEQFVLRDSTGADVRVISAATVNGGASYTISASLTAGRYYTIQVKPGILYQQYEPISFAVRKTITATLSELKETSMKLTFSERVAGLKASHIALRGADGELLEPNQYSIGVSTGDQGLTYIIQLGFFHTTNNLLLELNREDYRLASPVSFVIPSAGSLWLFETTVGQITFGIHPSPLPLTIDHVALTDSRGRAFPATLRQESETYYSLLGDFEPAETYYLAVTYPGFDFGAPLVVGVHIKSDAWITGENQSGFVLRMFPPVSGLQPADIRVTDQAGGHAQVQSVSSQDGGATYRVQVPLSGGRSYSVSIEKPGYLIRSTQQLSVASRQGTLSRVSVNGMTLRLSGKTPLVATDIVLLDAHDQAVPIKWFASMDGGYSYEIGADLETDRQYTLKMVKSGFDFGLPLSLSIQSVQTTFGGMAPDNNSAFIIHFSQAMPHMRPSDFRLRRVSDEQLLPVTLAHTDNGGLSYQIQASFRGGESYTVLPVKDSFDFGSPTAVAVPIFASAVLLGAASNEVSIGFSPAVPSMNAGNFLIKEDGAGFVSVFGAVTEDGGATYRIQTALRGGASYEIAVERAGYVMESGMSFSLPSVISSAAWSATEEGIRIGLSPGVPGLNEGAFLLKDDAGGIVAIESAETADRGFSYWLQAELAGGKTYSLTITSSGYAFGSELAVYVPVAASKSISDPTTDGFLVMLDRPIPGLAATHFKLLNAQGAPVIVQSAETADGGSSYSVRAVLEEGEVYNLNLVKNGYYFGIGIPFGVPISPPDESEPPISMTTSDVVAHNGFSLHFNVLMPGLTTAMISITDEEGQSFAPLSVSGLSHWSDESDYFVAAPIVPGKVYRVALVQTDQSTDGPVDVFVTLPVYPELVKATRAGIIIRLNNAGQSVLRAEDVSLYSSDESPIFIIGVTKGAEAGTYAIAASLAEGSSYRVALDKKAVAFDWQLQPDIIHVPITASVTAGQAGPGGFDLALSLPVEGVHIALFNGNGTQAFQPDSFVTLDGGRTYRASVAFPYDSSYTVELSKAGYDFGGRFTIAHISSPPKVLTAATDPGGRKIILSFDMALQPVSSDAPFSVKINNQWKGGVAASLHAQDPTKLELTWQDSGLPIGASAKVEVAYTGVNRVRAINGAYLALFSEMDVANVATLEGFVQSFPAHQGTEQVVRALRTTFSQTPLEAMILLRNAGFAMRHYANSVSREYSIGASQMVELLFKIDADATMLFNTLDYMGAQSAYGSLIAPMIDAGYDAVDISHELRHRGYQARDILPLFGQAGISANGIAAVARKTYMESSGAAAGILKNMAFHSREAGAAVQTAFGLTNEDTVKAVAAGGYTASEAVDFIRHQYSASGSDQASLLFGAGYTAAAIGGALMNDNPFADAEEAVASFHFAGFDAVSLYAMAKGLFSEQATASAMLEAGVQASSLAAAVHAAGDKPAIFLSAFLADGGETKVAVSHAAAVWGSSSTTLVDTMNGLAVSGVAIAERAATLRDVHGASIASAIAALRPAATVKEEEDMIATLVAAGYDETAVVAYYLHHVYRGKLDQTLSMLMQHSRVPLDRGLPLLRSAVMAGNADFTLDDALTVILNTHQRFAADEVLKALIAAFSQDGGADAAPYAKAMSDADRWSRQDIGRATIDRLGITLREWVAFAGGDIFIGQGCPCTIPNIVRDSFYLFPHATIEDITAAISQSERFTLTELVEGLSSYYNGIRALALPYLTAALKESGYPFTDIAAVFDAKGWDDWIWSFSRNGIAASEVVAYLKSINETDEDIVLRLEYYELKEIALALRTELGMSEGDASALLLPHYTAEEIGFALAFAYGGDAVELWIQTLREQQATAISVINTISARFPQYRDARVIGPALVRGGYGVDEVMSGLLHHTRSYGDMSTVVGLLRDMYSAEQLSITRLLSASASDTPEQGIMFLRTAGFGIPAMARGLKEHYGLASGRAAALLAGAYPNHIGDVLKAIAAAYDTDMGQTVGDALEEQGITTLEEAMPYLTRSGYSLIESISAVKEAFGLPAGEVAKRVATVNGNSPAVLLAAVSSVYQQSMLHTVHQRQLADGAANYGAAIAIGYEAGLSLREMVRMAKDNYGISSGSALASLTDSNRYSRADMIEAISAIYEMSGRDSIADSLQARGLTTLADAVPYLRNNHFDLKDIVRVGKSHYGLSSGETAAALIGGGVFTRAQIQNEVARVYEQPLEEAIVASLIAIGSDEWADGVQELWSRQYDLSEMAIVAQKYYHLDSGQAGVVLRQSGYFGLVAIIDALALQYGQTTADTVAAMLAAEGLSTLEDAAPFMDGNGMTLRDIIVAGKSHYGLSGGSATAIVNALGSYTLTQIQDEVAYVYDQTLDQTMLDALSALGITSFGEVISHLWGAGYDLTKLARIAKAYYQWSAGEAVLALQQSGYFGLKSSIAAIAYEYGMSTMTATDDTLHAGGFLALSDAIVWLRTHHFGLREIVQIGKEVYGVSGANASAALAADGSYALSRMQAEIAYVYEQPIEQAIVESLGAAGLVKFEDAMPELRRVGYELPQFVKVANEYYRLKAGETIVALQQSGYFGLPAILAAVAEEFGKPTRETATELLMNAGIAELEQAVYLLQRMGYGIRDFVIAAKEQYGLAAGDAISELTALSVGNPEVLQWTVASVYEQSLESSALTYIESGAIHQFPEAIVYLQKAGVPLPEIVHVASFYYYLGARETTLALLQSQLYSVPATLQGVNAVFAHSTNAIVSALTANGHTDPAAMIQNLRLAGIRLEDIGTAAKEELKWTEEQLRTHLQSMNGYDNNAIEQMLEAVYRGGNRANTLNTQIVVLLNDIRTPEGAIAFMRKAQLPLEDIVAHLKELYGLSVAETTEQLKPHYRLIEIGLATGSVYATNRSLKYLSEIMDPLDVSDTPAGLARFMYGKFLLDDIVAALHWFYGLHAQAMFTAFSQTSIPKEEYTRAVTAHYGENALFHYFYLMKTRGASARDIAIELERQQQLGAGKQMYLVDFLLSLGYDRQSILRTVYAVYPFLKGTELSIEQHTAIMIALGYDRAEEVVEALNYYGYVHSKTFAGRVYRIVDDVVPYATPSEIARAMKAKGHNGVDILNVLRDMGSPEVHTIAFMKEFGYSAEQAFDYMSGRTLEEKVYWMVHNGYRPVEYLKYTNYRGSNVISLMKQQGMSANELAYTLHVYGERTYTIASVLHKGGFTDLTELATAMLAGRSHPSWVLDDLRSLGQYSTLEIAQAMLDSEMLSLVDLASAISMSNEGDMNEVYLTIREVSKKEQKALYDSLEEAERAVLGDEYIAVIVALTTLRAANVNVQTAASLLRSVQRIEFEMGSVLLVISGYDTMDVIEAIFTVYQNEFGIFVLKTMIGKTMTKVFTEMKNMYRVINLVYHIVKRVVKQEHQTE